MSPLEIFAAARINGIYQGLQDVRLLPGQANIWTPRIPDTPALDEEITARYIDFTQIADIIADDSEAVTYAQGKMQYETVKIPNLKHGTPLNQQMLNQLDRLSGMPMGGGDLPGIFAAWENRTLQKLLLGISQRKEALLIAMLCDGLTYDRLGMKISTTWGMPSDLKVTPTFGWDDATNGTPITDLNTMRRNAQARYGKTFNRATMSTSALQYAVKTTEFKDQAKVLFGFGLISGTPAPAIPLQSDAMMKDILQRIIAGTSGAFTIEIDDRRYQSQDVNGLNTFYPFMPITKVILTDSNDDNNRNAMDWAQGEVTEAIVSRLSPVNIMGRIPAGYGPRAYATGNPNLNPPNITYWAVERGFPRKHQLQASGCLTVGTFTDTIAVGVPFPS